MKTDEIELAAEWGIPIICDGIRYRRVSALIVRYSPQEDNGCRKLRTKRYEAELESYSNSVSICNQKNVEPEDSDEFSRRVEAFRLYSRLAKQK